MTGRSFAIAMVASLTALIARSAVAADMFDIGLAANGAQGEWPMGMLEEWVLSRDRRRLCVATDGGGTFVLTLASAGGRQTLSQARYVGDGLCGIRWAGATRGS